MLYYEGCHGALQAWSQKGYLVLASTEVPTIPLGFTISPTYRSFCSVKEAHCLSNIT